MSRTWEEYCTEVYPNITVVNLGCGHNNPKEWYGVDIQQIDGVDCVTDLTQGIPLENDSTDIVLARDFLEHIPQGQANIKIMEEIYRIIKPGGQFEFDVPSTDGNNQGAFCDPTHISFWNEYKFRYFFADKVKNSHRRLYDIKAYFVPVHLQTYLNDWNCTYVKGLLKKELSE